MTRMLSEWIGVLALVVGMGLVGYQVYTLGARHRTDRLNLGPILNVQIRNGVFTLHSVPDNLDLLAHLDRNPKNFRPPVTGNYGWRNRWIGFRVVNFPRHGTLWAINFPAILPGLAALLLALVCYRTARRLPQRDLKQPESKDPWSDDEE